MASRIFLAFGIILSTAAFVLTLLAQPPDGTVVGVCADARTGLPLAHVAVTLIRQTEGDGESAPTQTVQNARGGTGAPDGWRQDSGDDARLAFSGDDTTPQDEWRARTDAQGRFTIPHVRVGQYTLDANSSGHTLDKALPVVLTEGQTESLAVRLGRDDPRLSFESPTRNWTPEEDPTVSLNGLLETRSVDFAVERLDVPGALARQPLLLTLPSMGSDSDDTLSKLPPWPGEYTPVRHWTYTIGAADYDGSFLDRVPLGVMPEGLYRVTATAHDDGKTVTAVGWTLVTRLALVRKSDHDHLLAFVTDIVTGKPVRDVPVVLYDRDEHALKTLGRAQTGADGLAHLPMTGGSPESQGTLVARRGASVVALSLVLNSPGDEDSGPAAPATTATARSLREFIYTDRPVYRPGQTVNLKGIARWFAPQAGFTLPAHQLVTVEIKDAQDTLISHQQVQTDDMGSWTETLTLSTEALTGEYTIHTTLGDDSSDGTFSVAAYHKPEYQATIAFSKDRYIHGEAVAATITATYYYGAPVSGAQATIYAYRGESSETDSGNSNADDQDSTSGEPIFNKTVKLDGNGQTHVQFPTKGEPNEGDQSYNLQVDIDDSSGHNVHAEGGTTVAQGLFSLTATPAALIARAGTPLEVAVAATQQAGTPQASADVEVQAGYDVWSNGQDTFTQVSDAHVTTEADGAARATVSVLHTGLLSLRLSSRDTRGNRITTQTDVWVPGDDEDIPAKLPDLAVILDKKKYTVGETAHVLINTSHPGPSALVTMEGDSLYRAVVVPLTRHANAVDLPVTAEDDPGVTVKVCCITAKQFQESSASLVVNDDHRALNVSVTADKANYHPGDPATLRVRTTDASGHPVPAEISVGVVDSAVYAIQPEPPGTIGDAIMPDQESGVQTDNSCPEIYEGDVDKGSTNIDIRRKFPDTALWKPDVRTGPDGRATVVMNLPDTLTTWRITCVGHTADTLVGKGVGTMVVNKDLLVRLETPPFLTAGDTGTLIALVHNNTASPLHARVRLAATGLSVQGDTSREVDVAPGEPTRLTWDVRAAQNVPATVQLTAAAGALSDGVEEPIPVLPHGATQETWHSGTLLQRVSQDVTLDSHAIPGATMLRVRLSSSLSSALQPALDYLDAYPYGSSDATASVLIPDSLLAQGSPSLPLSAAQRSKLADTVSRAVLRLGRFQNLDGGWGWFTTDKSDLWMTAYAAWGLTLARDAGHPVNPEVLGGAARRLKELTAGANHHATGDGRFALAALALAGLGENQAALDDLRLLQRQWAAHPEDADPSDLAMAALAAHRLGPLGAGLAQTLMTQLWSVCRQTGSLSSWTMAGHRSQAGVADDLPDTGATGWALLAAEAITPNDPRLDGAARWLMLNRTDDHWCDGDSTAVAVLALAQYMGRAHELQPAFTAHLIVNGLPVRALHFGPESLTQPDQIIDLPGTALKSGINTVALDKSGPGRLYYALDLKQCLTQPAPPPPPTLWTRLVAHIEHPGGVPLPPAPSGYRVKRVYLRLTSRRNFLWEDTVPAPDTHLNAGESVLVRLIVQCTRPSSRVVIEEPVPAGCRIAETAGDGIEEWDNWWDYTDVRDDKIVFFVRDLTRGEHEIDYHLQAQTPGTFDVMPTLLTSTVDPTLYALGLHADQIRIDAKG